MVQYVSENNAAKLWLKIVGGSDKALPEDQLFVGVKRRKMEDADEKILEEEIKENPEKRVVKGNREQEWEGPDL